MKGFFHARISHKQDITIKKSMNNATKLSNIPDL